MTAPTEPLVMTLEEALQLVERNESGNEPRMTPTGHGRWYVSFFGRNFTVHDTWEEAASHALGRPVVARDPAAELRAAIRGWAKAKEDEAELDSDTSRQHVRDAEAELFLHAALAVTEGEE